MAASRMTGSPPQTRCELHASAGALQKGSSAGEAERQEDKRAEICAARRDIALGHLRLVSAESERKPPVAVKGLGDGLAADYGRQGRAHGRRR